MHEFFNPYTFASESLEVLIMQENQPFIDLKNIADFKQLYSHYWEKVYSYCAYQLDDKDAAKDLTQDIFISLWERREEIDIRFSIEHYLMRACKFKTLEYLRNNIIKRTHNDRIASEQPDSTTETEDEIIYKDLINRVLHSSQQLPEQCRKVFTMSRMMGLSNKEISVSLDVSERAVEYHIAKALSFLRKNIPEYKHISVILWTGTAFLS